MFINCDYADSLTDVHISVATISFKVFCFSLCDVQTNKVNYNIFILITLTHKAYTSCW
jgi:hypothetical protein